MVDGCGRRRERRRNATRRMDVLSFGRTNDVMCVDTHKSGGCLYVFDSNEVGHAIT